LRAFEALSITSKLAWDVDKHGVRPVCLEQHYAFLGP
jgi:hypothetical protein